MKRKLLFGFAVLVTVLTLPLSGAFAGTTGKITGRITDDKGGTLPGASVILEGMKKGAVTDKDGFYTILSVDPGSYSLTASLVGYTKVMKRGVNVTVDYTTTVDFRLREEAVQAAEVVVTAERPPVEPDKTSSKYVTSADEIRQAPIVKTTGEFVSLQPGVDQAGTYSIRGSDINRGARPEGGGDYPYLGNDVYVMIDGVRIANNDGHSALLFTGVNKSAVQELSVETGVTPAEYGNAQGGTINIVTQEGAQRLHGWTEFQYEPAGKKHWGANVYDSPQNLNHTRWNDPAWVQETDPLTGRVIHQRADYTKWAGYRAEGSLSGPIGPNASFLASVKHEERASIYPAAEQQAYRNYWSNDEDWSMDDWYKYDSSLKMLYDYDGDHPLYNAWDDTGDPYYDAYASGSVTYGGKIGQTEGQILSFAHVGMGVLAYTDKGASNLFNARDRNQGYITPEGDQPYALRFWESFNPNSQNDPNLGKLSEAKMYSEVTGAGRRIDPNPDHPSGQFSMLLFGPYNLPPGGKAKIVLAYAAGQPGQMLGNTDPFTWARSSASVAQKQSELPKGLDALKQNLSAAKFAYDNAFDIPDAPPDVNFRTGSSAYARMQVDWPDDVEKAAHPDYTGTEANDIAGYRVYRSTWFDVGPWDLLADIPKGTSKKTSAYEVTYSNNLYTFEDLQSAAGFFYHYSVRAYAKGHKTWSPGSANSPLGMAQLPAHIQQHVQQGLEGGWAAPTQRIYADESPYQSPVADTESLTRRVLVVPNPYIVDNQHAYPGSTSIRFVGIPSKCRVRVYSVSGDLVANFTHDNPTKGEHDFNQITWTNSGYIATGAYFFVVENLIDGPDKGKLQRGTFMVIR